MARRRGDGVTPGNACLVPTADGESNVVGRNRNISTGSTLSVVNWGSAMSADSAKLRSLRLCPYCGYDLRGQVMANPDGQVRCPECGELEPPPPVRKIAKPGVIWHILVAVSFGLPLVLTALEAADQMVNGGWAPVWLMPLDIAGAVGIIACTFHGKLYARNRASFVAEGLVYLVIYLTLLILLGVGIDWMPYRT